MSRARKILENVPNYFVDDDTTDAYRWKAQMTSSGATRFTTHYDSGKLLWIAHDKDGKVIDTHNLTIEPVE